MIKRLLSLMCIGLACGSVVAQSLSDVLCSIQERKALYVTDVEDFLVQGEEELKVSGSSTPAGQFTTWGAPLKSTDYTTGLSDIRAYDGNLERLGSNTDPLGVNTAVTARDAFGRVTGYNWKGHTGTVTPGALSVSNSLNMGGGAANPSSTRTWDAMGRMLSDNQTMGGVTHARGATYNANTRTIETELTKRPRFCRRGEQV